MAHIGQPPSKGSATAIGPDMNPPPYSEGEPKLKKAVKAMEKSDSKKPEKSVKKLTTKERVNRIVEGNDPGYHL